jgi:hypothetical protein
LNIEQRYRTMIKSTCVIAEQYFDVITINSVAMRIAMSERGRSVGRVSVIKNKGTNLSIFHSIVLRN